MMISTSETMRTLKKLTTLFTFLMSEDLTRIANALERIATSFEKETHIVIDHGHIEKIDNIEHGDIDTHTKRF